MMDERRADIVMEARPYSEPGALIALAVGCAIINAIFLAAAAR